MKSPIIARKEEILILQNLKNEKTALSPFGLKEIMANGFMSVLEHFWNVWMLYFAKYEEV